MPEEFKGPRFGLEQHGLKNLKKAWWNLNAAQLYEHALRREEAVLSAHGALVVNTGKYTGRSPNDKFIIDDAASHELVDWGKVNRGAPEKMFDALLAKQQQHLAGKEVFVQDCHVGADEQHRMPVRIITENAWQNLFSRNMFIPLKDRAQWESFVPQFVVLHTPNLQADPKTDGTQSEAFIVVSFSRKMILIGGTRYGGEIKKSIFSVMNFLLPQKNVLPMHCSANIGKNGDTAVFFGLSGTGKTTLSADPERFLIGDDEHGWSDSGVFNFEGGCYAKVIRLSAEAEPEIYACTRRFGTVLENVVIDPATRAIDLDSDVLTENTRASYPIDFIPNIVPDGRGGQPKNVIFLTCDAFGVLPPVAKLTADQASYHFLAGYTAKVAGTERGIKEPQATFSACFGAPFMPMAPTVYAELLGRKIQQHKVQCWLLNTGWTGGPYGVGKRISIKHTRALLSAALSGKLSAVKTVMHPFFGLEVPVSCPEVPPEIMDPSGTWRDKGAYEQKARELVAKFHENAKKFKGLSEKILKAGPPQLAETVKQ